jgi:uncharacterized membrane protein YqhA
MYRGLVFNLAMLTLIDLRLAANLQLIVLFSRYENVAT